VGEQVALSIILLFLLNISFRLSCTAHTFVLSFQRSLARTCFGMRSSGGWMSKTASLSLNLRTVPTNLKSAVSQRCFRFRSLGNLSSTLSQQESASTATVSWAPRPCSHWIVLHRMPHVTQSRFVRQQCICKVMASRRGRGEWISRGGTDYSRKRGWMWNPHS
jgi:hypothetical protein